MGKLYFDVVRKEVNTFAVEDTPENRALVEAGDIYNLTIDKDGHYKNLWDSYGEIETVENMRTLT